MLEELRLKNFRCFSAYKISFDKFNVIVGKNDAGKSTIIDALKLVSNVRRYSPYRDHDLKDRDIPFSLVNLRHDYVEKDSSIYSKFSDKTEIEVIFPVEEPPYVEFVRGRRRISETTELRRYFKHAVGVIPPVGTFEESESLGSRKYIHSVLVSRLTPRHFRNIWLYFPEGFDEFRKLIEVTWPGYTIELPELDPDQNRITMFFQENRITREIFWAGHGFQVWLQLMTFVVKLGLVDTLVLDEPDIYLHSDMQKKLVSICTERSNQVIIATHAVDIIEEVQPAEIVSIDKSSTESTRLSSVDEVQTCITQLGSSQNLKLVHLIRGKSCLFVEGQEFRYLKAVARKLSIDSFVKETGFTVVPLEGFSNWDRLMHIKWVFINALGEQIKCYVILDRDYYTDEEISEIETTLENKGVKIHVWHRKEIENYIINYDALYRMFKSRFCERHQKSRTPLSRKRFIEGMESILEGLKNHVQSQVVARRLRGRRDRSIDESTIVSQALARFEDNWKLDEYRRIAVPGKEVFARLNCWLQDAYKTTIPVGYVFASLRVKEIETEIGDVITEFVELVES